MCPAGKFLNVQQGDRNIKDYARDFVGVARQSALEETCLVIFFSGGLAEPFKSCMPYWLPEESLEVYINRVLYLKGSSFKVELAAVPGQKALKATVPSAHRSPEAVASAHRSPEAVVSAHVYPEMAAPAHIPLEVAVNAHRASYPFLGHPGADNQCAGSSANVSASGFVCSRPIQRGGTCSQSSRSGTAQLPPRGTT